jgi:hypothetical protein
MAKKRTGTGRPNNAGQATRVYNHMVNGKKHNCNRPKKATK